MSDSLEDLKRSIGMHELVELADREGLHRRGSGRNRAECPGCRNGDPRGASIGERDGVGVWKCHRDEQHRGSAIDFLMLCRSISIADAVRELERTTGTTPRPAVRRPAPSPPPAAEVAAFWASCRPLGLDSEIADAWAARGIDIDHIEDRDLARALPRGAACPGWATFRGEAWSFGRHRLIVPMYDAAGRVRSLHARAATAEKPLPKGLSPAGHAVGGLVMADPLARLLLAALPLGDGTLAADAVRLYGLVIVEGVPDFLTWATRWGDAGETAPAVAGLIAGSWTAEIAARVPAGTKVSLRAHADEPGAKYMRHVAQTLAGRCTAQILVNGGAP